LQCSSSETMARELNQYIRDKGYSTWICVEMQGGNNYRDEIVVNAAGSKVLIALMNVKWADSKECRYEFNIALRANLTKGFPHIIPVIMENFDWSSYPTLVGTMANTNAIFYEPNNPSATWNKVVDSFAALGLQAKGQINSTPAASIASPDVKVVSPLPSDIAKWDIKNVSQWSQSLDIPVPKDAFQNSWVDGPILLEITPQDLQESLKLNGLQTKRLMREINLLKSKPSQSATAQTSALAPSSAYSKKGFKTGIWAGWYEYPNGKQEETSVDATMVAEVVAGYGTDEAGDFLFQGTYSDKTLEISWDKVYIGQHTVEYLGKLTNGDTITGTWRIASDRTFGGRFCLKFKK